MTAINNFVIVENLEEDGVSKTNGGFYVTTKSANVGHYKVLSVSSSIKEPMIKKGDTIWVLTSNVSYSSNFESEKIGIIKYDNIMSKD